MIDLNIDLSMNDSAALYGWSKMIAVNEQNDNAKQHYTMKQVEFYEYIGRLAYNQINDVQGLDKKIEVLLDTLLPKFGFKRIPVGGVVDDD